MLHRRPLTALIATAAAVLLPSASLAQPKWDEVQINTSKLAEGVYMLQGWGGNLGLSVGPDGAFLIDDQYAPLSKKIKAAIAEVSKNDVKFVLNTHWHGDHTGGNENFGQAGAMIVAHENVRARLSKAQALVFFESQYEASPEGALPVVTFTDAMTFHWNGDDIRVFHVKNAHTDGDSVIHFRKANVIHTGDVVFNGYYCFIDYEHGGSIDGVIEAVSRILELADSKTMIIPGHGPLTGHEELAGYRDMLTTVRDRIDLLMKDGKSADEIVAAKPTAEFDAEWGNGFIKADDWVRMVHTGMVARRDGTLVDGGAGGI